MARGDDNPSTPRIETIEPAAFKPPGTLTGFAWPQLPWIKFAVFASVLQLGGLAGPVGWLVILAIALSAVALYYYLLILKQALVAAPAENAVPVRVSLPAVIALLVAAGLIVALGLWPSAVLGLF